MDTDWDVPAKLRAVQTALYNHTALCRSLWPMDYTPEAIGHILVKMDWGGSSRTDAARAGLVEQFFNHVMIENAARAVKKKPPAQFRRLKEIWEDIAESAGTAKTAVPQHPGSTHDGQHGGGAGRGGRSGKGGKSGRGGYTHNPAQPAPVQMAVARVGSLFVCHRFNEQHGCGRTPSGQGCLGLGGRIFAHACNAKKADGEFCLGNHPAPKHK